MEAFYRSGLTDVTLGLDSQLQVIGAVAFASTPINGISLPKSLIVIGSFAFSGCLLLSNITFENNSNLRVIGAYAFEKTHSLEDIFLPDSLTELGDFAFIESSLKGDILISSNLTYFGAGAFASCHSLENIIVDNENATYQSIDGVVYTKDGKNIIAYPAGNSRFSYVILDGVETISDASFYGSANLLYTTLPDSAIYIKEYAFAYMSSLRSIEITKNVMQVSSFAFLYDMAMSTITFNEDCVLPRISFGSFAYSGITSIRIPKTVSTIAQGTFEGCTNLKYVTFEKNSTLESISAYMFDGASNLINIVFESGSALNSIQAHGLEGMSKLTSVDFGNAPLTNIDNFAVRFCDSLTSFNIPDGVVNVGRYAFYGCSRLNSVTIPESVEHIGSYAFLQTSGNIDLYFESDTLPIYLDEDWDRGINGYYLGVTNIATSGDYKYASLSRGGVAILEYNGSETSIDLNSLDFGGDIVTIGGSSFAYSTVNDVILPDSLVTIQRSAFYHSSLNSITIPSQVEFIGAQAFADTSITSLDLSSANNLKVIEQSAFEETKKLNSSVIIPATVTTLGRAIFRNSSVNEVSIDSATTITEIPIDMFYGSKIQSFTIPDSVTKIDDGAFELTSNLESIVYGENLTWLGARAFYKSGLKTFNISNNLTVIEEFALVALENLKSFSVDNDNPYYKAEDGLLLSKEGKKLIAVPAGRNGSLAVPQSVEVIGFGAFEASSLSEVLFDNSSNILSIGYRAFFGAEQLTTITIPSSVVSIDYYAFAYAKRLKKVIFADGSRLKGIYEGAFYGCIALNQTVIPDSIVEISDYAFYGCTKLTTLPVSNVATIKGIYSYSFAYTGIKDLVIPDSVIDIDNYAFLGASLVNVTIPDTNMEDLVIGLGAFEDCNYLESISLPFIGSSYNNTDITWFGYIFGAGGYQANAAYIPTNIRNISITQVRPESWSYWFKDLTFSSTFPKLEEILLPNGLNSIGSVLNYAFRDCVNLTNVLIPESVTSIESCAFYNCSNLTSISIPTNVTSIGYSQFKDCTSLISITMSNNIMSIGDNAFEGCVNLLNLVIPNNVTSLGDYAFYNCKSLISITIPDSVTSIGIYAFENCCSLKDISIPSGVTAIGYCTFANCNSLTSITFGMDSLLSSIERYAFCDCTNLMNITIPESVTSIGDYALFNCSNIETITIPDGVTFMGSSVFCGCSNLTSVIFGKNSQLASIGNYTFTDCSSLTSVNIPDSVTSIGSYAFRKCNNLSIVAIGENSQLTSIGDSAFFECITPFTITIPAGLSFIGEGAFSSCRITDVYVLDIDAWLNNCKNYKSMPNNSYLTTLHILDENGCNVEEIMIPDCMTTIPANAFCGLNSLTSVTFGENSQLISIDEKAFGWCSNLFKITIPDSVTVIGQYAFYCCSNLTSVTFEKNSQLLSIDFCAFHGCSSLTKITIPDGVTSIGSAAFMYCSNLTSINIPEGLTALAESTFFNCLNLFEVCNNSEIDLTLGSKDNGYVAYYAKLIVDKYGNKTYKNDLEDVTYIDTVDDFRFIVEAGIYKLIAYIGETDTITLPDEVNGNSYEIYKMIGAKNVIIPDSFTFISGEAFCDCNSLISITIPNRVTSIGDFAFSGCSSLTCITIPTNVSYIGSYAFSHCSRLTSITIPDGVTSIGSGTFYNCSSLNSLTIPDSVTSIGSYAFSGCSSLTSITIPDSVTSIDSSAFIACNAIVMISEDNTSFVTHDGVIYNKDISQIIAVSGYVTEIIIPFSVTSFDFRENKTLQVVSFENASSNSVTSIASRAFYGCSSLTTITIPDSVTFIGGGSAFSDCSSLTSITIPDGVTSIEYRTFYNCTSLTSITIPDSVASIGDSAFAGCSSLTSITIPEGVTSIESSSFCDCNSLIRITIPDSVSSIGSSAFSGCSSLLDIKIPNNITSIPYYLCKNCSSLTSITIPDSVASIGDSAFENCSLLTTVIIPNCVTDISNSLFSGCSNLSSVTLPNSIKTLGASAFSNCSRLNNITIPDSVTYIGASAFENCSSLCNVYISDIESWLNICFNGYEKTHPNYYGELHILDSDGNEETDIIIPDTITSIPDYAFYNCRGLVNITFGNESQLISIGERAFSGCNGLTSIEIPKSVCLIGFCAFDNSGLKDVYIVDIESWLKIVLNSSSSYPPSCLNCSVLHYIDDNDIESTTIEILDDIHEISDYAFYNFRNIASITIPNNVTSIGSCAFYNCSSLTSISVPDSVSSIGSYAFHGCSSLTSITIPDGVTSIASGTFYNCSSLNSITIPDSVTSIGSYAFHGCYNLVSITIPDGVTTIEERTFEDCYNMTSIIFGDNSQLSAIYRNAFDDCNSLTSFTIPKLITTIDTEAFSGCDCLYVIYNNSDIVLNISGFNYGGVAFSARLIVDKFGNKTYRSDSDNLTYLDTVDDFRFIVVDGVYELIAYLGYSDTITLPTSVNGSSYKIYHMRGVKNVIIPNTITSIDSNAFNDCKSLISVTIANSVTYIGSYAFFNCSGLTKISISEDSQLSTIKNFAFLYCSNLDTIVLPDCVEHIGCGVFEGTAYYNDANNWTGGSLYNGNHLIKVDTNAKYYKVNEETITIAEDAFEECYRLKHLTIGGSHSSILTKNYLTNLETLVITEMPMDHYIYEYFGYSSYIPITLTNIVLGKGVSMRDNAFMSISDITIFVSKNEKDVRWDDNYTNWSNGNKVVYGDGWINVDFYNPDGTLYSSEIILTDQVIRIPTIRLEDQDSHYYVSEGWDLDGDGVVESFPATSSVDISAKLIVSEVTREYNVIFYDSDNITVLHIDKLEYGSRIDAPANPQKRGYSFLAWIGYTDGMTVNDDISFVAKWSHNGGGHNYDTPIWIDATCTVGGYYKHTCTICGEWYGSDFTEPNGHAYVKTTVNPSCAEDGYDLYTCYCGDCYKDNYIDKLGHSFGKCVVDIEATCTSNGFKHRDCTCGYSEVVSIEATGHEYTSTITKEPTCSYPGEITYTCHCGYKITESISQKEHNFEKIYANENWIQQLIRFIINLFFGYDEGKPYYFKCTECGHIATSSEVTLKYSSSSSAMSVCEHTLDDWDLISPASCITPEIEGRHCSKCGDVVEYRETYQSIGHNYGDWINELPVSCTSIGILGHYQCSNCGKFFDSNYNELDSIIIVVFGHTESDWIIDTNAECTHDGSKHKECTICNAILEIEVIQTNGHSYGTVQTENATCTKDGCTYHICTVCGHNEKLSTITATGHTNAEAVKENNVDATCTTDGSYEMVVYCSVCGDELSRVKTTVDATGHTESDWIIDTKAECTHDGSKHKECTVCESILKIEDIEALGHSYGTVQTNNATCTEDGCTHHICTVCGHNEKLSTITATGHTEAKAVKENNVDATCTTDGSYEMVVYCSVCGDELSRVKTTVDATGHSGSDWIIDTNADCTHDGSKHKKCTICNAILEIEVIQTNGHSYDTIQTETATCTKDGCTYHICSVCGHNEKLSTITATGHTEAKAVKENNVDATCTTDGSYEMAVYCSVCDDELSRVKTTVDATGHTESDWIIDINSDCIHAGSKHKECTVCGSILNIKTISVLGHSLGDWINFVSPTCTNYGIIGHYHCSVCDMDIDENNTELKSISVPAFGHTEGVWIIDTNADCTHKGSKHKECTVCNAILEIDVIQATGHSYGDWISEVEARCTETGVLGHYHCYACNKDFDADGNELESLIINPIGHFRDIWYEGTPATCTENGTIGYYSCARCSGTLDVNGNEIYNLVVETNGHDYGEWNNEVSATCTTNGILGHYHCSKCNKNFDSYYNELSSIAITATGHKEGDWIEDYLASCTHMGVQHKECTACGVILEIGRSPTYGHIYGDWISEVESTCMDSGVLGHYYCLVCNKNFDANYEELESLIINPIGHIKDVWYDECPATCTENGMVGYYSCAHCSGTLDVNGNEIYNLVIESKGHSYGEWIDEVIVTCTTDGVIGHYHCSICNKNFDSNYNELGNLTIEATGHTESDWIFDIVADCTHGGSVHRECTVCKTILEIEIFPISGHGYYVWISEVEAKCTEPGVVCHYHCYVCNKDFDADGNDLESLIINPIGHIKDVWYDEIPATCTENGRVGYYSCARCSGTLDANGNEIFNLVIDATGHTPAQTVRENVIDATPTADGSYDAVVYCAICGDELSRERIIISALGHDYSAWIEEIPATCTTNGVKGHYHCNDCGKDYDAYLNELDSLVIRSNGHYSTDWTIDIAANCSHSGSKHRECLSCGLILEISEIQPVGHNYYVYSVTDPTCVAQGFTTHMCQNCGDTYNDTWATATGHIESEWIVDITANCINAGSKHRECTACGTITSISPISATGHTAGSCIIDVPADCTHSGSQHMECGVCGYVISLESIPATGHCYGEVITVDSTCTTEGSTYRICGTCGGIETISIITAKGHTPAQAVRENVVDATLTSDGSYELVVYCSICGDELSRTKTVVPANEHVAGDWIIDSIADCTHNGSKHKECVDCGTILSLETISALGHNYGDWIDEVSATCTTDGVVGHYHCSECNINFDVNHKELSDLVIEATGHTEGKAVKENNIDATCTIDGSYEMVVYCSVCGDELSRVKTTVDATGHTESDWIVDTNADCTHDGSKHKECTECESILKIEDIEALGHSYGTVQTENATCTKDGCTYHICTVCGHNEKLSTITATGHTEAKAVKENNVDATCTIDGSYEMVVYCSVCGDELSRVKTTVDATGHTESDWIIDTNADCIHDGSKHKECTICNAILEIEGIEATGHSCGEILTREATCVDSGSRYHICSICGDENIISVIPATGHSYTGAVTKEATVTENGIMTYTCHCGATYDEIIDKLPTEIIDKIEDAWDKKSESKLRLPFSGKPNDFVELQVGGKVVDPSFYSINLEEGVIEVDSEYLNTLGVGEHEVLIVSKDGAQQTSFTISDSTSNGALSGYSLYILIGSVVLVIAVVVTIIIIHHKHSRREN